MRARWLEYLDLILTKSTYLQQVPLLENCFPSFAFGYIGFKKKTEFTINEEAASWLAVGSRLVGWYIHHACLAGRVPPSVSPYRPQAAASAASPPPALSARPAPDRSPPAHVRIHYCYALYSRGR